MSSIPSLGEINNIEAVLRRSAAAIPGAQVFKERISLDDSGPRALPDDNDEAEFRRFQQAKAEDLDIPQNVDLMNSWKLLEECAPREVPPSSLLPFRTEEHSLNLGKDGLPEHHICQYCQHIVIRCNVSEELERVLVARSREELDQAAKDGCTTLEWLGWYLYTQLTNPPSDQSEIYLVSEPLEGCEHYLGAVRGEFVDVEPNQKGQRGKGEFGPFSVVTPYEDPASLHVRDRPVNLAVGSDKSFEKAKEWIWRCHNWDHECSNSYQVELPSWLLSVSDDPVKLVKITGLMHDIRYAALSYCWGGEQEQKTTKSNLRERQKDGMMIAELPNALQDAVVVTKKIGLMYLWIDSLCIVQDDTAQKNAEVAKMRDIYTGAFVTISAASSRSANEGFLQHRKPSAIRRHVFPVQYERKEGCSFGCEECEEREMGWAYLYRPETYETAQEPLNKRGWALQEYLLSPRLLIYGFWQVRWVCRVTQFSDGGPDHVYPPSFEKLKPKLLSKRTHKDIEIEMRKAIENGRRTKAYHCMKEMEDIIDFWPILVEEFTRRSLSIPSDRSAAMYGVAHEYSTLCNDTRYAAGLWANNIARQLLWKRPRFFRKRTRSDDCTLPYPAPMDRTDSAPNPGTSANYVPSTALIGSSEGNMTASASVHEPAARTPSWSWISVDGQVTWPLNLASKKLQIEVLRCDTAKFGPMGAAGDIPLTVRGRMREAFHRESAFNVLHLSSSLDTLKAPSESTREADTSPAGAKVDDLALTANAVFDSPDKNFGPDGASSVFLLEILPYTGNEHNELPAMPAGIILSLNQDRETYRRIGYFDFEWPDGVWLCLHDSGSKDHDNRRLGFRQKVFADCAMQAITVL